MRYYLAACFLGLVLGVALGLLLVTLDDAVESFDPNDAPAFLRLAARSLRAIVATARDLADTFITADAEQNPPPPVQLSSGPASRPQRVAW
jgi:hypothetical protein